LEGKDVKRTAVPALISCALIAIGVVSSAFADTKLTIVGSTALLPLIEAAANDYRKQNPGVTIDVAGGGSVVGIDRVAAHAVDIGDSDIQAPSHPELYDNRVAVIGFAVVTNAGVAVKSLTRAQIQDIFTGKATNWSALGGPALPIVVVNRSRNSGTRAVFAKTVMGGKPIADSALTEDATATVISTVKQTPGAISYVAFSWIKDSGLNALAIDGVGPADRNVVTGRYTFWSYEHMLTYGKPSGEAARFIDFVQTRRELLAQNGYIGIADMKVSATDR
jgi:phosphate transport system substrate-binding protein